MPFNWIKYTKKVLIKKLIFAPLFLLFFALTNFYLQPLLGSTDLILSLNSDLFIHLIILGILLMLTSSLFVIFSSLAQDWKLILPVVILAQTLPIIFFSSYTGLVLTTGFLISFALTSILLLNKLKTYLTFSPSSLLVPSVKTLAFYLSLSISFAYYLSANLEISKNGFEIPDSLIEASLKISSPNPTVKDVKLIAQTPTLTPEQIQLLRQNPDLLRKQGIDPKVLDTLDQQTKPINKLANPASPNPSPDLIKKLVKDQLQTVLKPYQGWVAPVLALLFYFTLSFLLSILSLVISPLIWLIFYILEKSGFTKYTTETREVKKLIVF